MKAESVSFLPVHAETGNPCELAMQRLEVWGDLLPIGARLRVRHCFQIESPQPIEAIYAFALPRDAAMRRFRIRCAGQTVRSELRPTEEAVRHYETNLERGHLAVLARHYQDGIVNLTVGNLRSDESVVVDLEVLAGVDAREDGIRFRFPFTLAPAYHRAMRAVLLDDNTGEIELPTEEFGDLMLPAYKFDAKDLHEVGLRLRLHWPGEIAEVGSPSHAIVARRESPGRHEVRLAADRELPNRDFVLDVKPARSEPLVLAARDAQGTARYAVRLPASALERDARPEAARRVVFVLDRSGSMAGDPIRQARRAIEACLTVLAPEDRFGIVAFDSTTEILSPDLLSGSRERLDEARAFLEKIDARGGTDLAAGFEAAARLLQVHGGGDVLLLTDGEVFGTDEILSRARAAGVRIHALGIGSASQDRFLALLGRETGGTSRFLTPRERVDLEVVDLFASIGRPVADGLRASGDGLVVQPDPPSVVFPHTAVVIHATQETRGVERGRLARDDGAEPGSLLLEWSAGGTPSRMEIPLPAGQALGTEAFGETLRLMQGARLIADLEARAPETKGGAAGRRAQDRYESRLRALSEEYALASRVMSLVAVVERAGDRAGELPETRVVPVGLPPETDPSAYFPASFGPETVQALAATPDMSMPRLLSRRADMSSRKLHSLASWDAETDLSNEIFACVTLLQGDGGMPGSTDDERIARSALLLLALLSEGSTAASGVFRLHAQRLLRFLESPIAETLPPEKRMAVERTLEMARAGYEPREAVAPAIRRLPERSAEECWRSIEEILRRS